MSRLADDDRDRDDSGIFSPFSLKTQRLANRFVMPAMQRGWTSDGKPNAKLVEYYRERTAGGVSLLISESCAIDHPTSAGQRDALYVDDTTVDAWRRCVDAVHGAGGSMLIQLFHEGALRQEGAGRYPHAPTISPSGLADGQQSQGRAATIAELDELLAAYVQGALDAQAVGADGVEVHAAHGYLLDQFLWATTNLRSDEFGGPHISDRVRFPLEVVKAIRAAVEPDFLVGFRFSQWKAFNYDAHICESPDELGTMLSMLADAGVDFFHASSRYFWKPEWDTDRTIAAWCKELTDVPVIMVGSVGLNIDMWTTFLEEQEAQSTVEGSISELQRRFALGEFDLVAVGRGVIGDPEWVHKAAEGRYADIRPFMRSDLDMSDWDMESVKEAHTPTHGG